MGDGEEVQIRFASSVGYLESGAIRVDFPACMNVGSYGGRCAGYLDGSVGLGGDATCSVANNTLAISGVYSNYNVSKSRGLYLSVKLREAHSCSDTDFVIVRGVNALSGSLLEAATVTPPSTPT